MSAVEKCKAFLNSERARGANIIPDIVMPAIDALEAELTVWEEANKSLSEAKEKAEAENERLRVCGTCGHMEQWDDDTPGCHYEICNIEFDGGVGDASVASPCRLTPSRWTPYWEEG
jgi:hypothetical protein